MKFLNNEDISFEDATNTDIVNHIVKNHHAFIKEELPEIEELVFTIYRVHFVDSGDVLEKVHRLFGRLKIEFESHMIKEERALFYMIKDYDNHPSEELLENILEGIKSVEENNKKIKEILLELRKVTSDYVVPSTACPTYINTYNKIQEIEKDTKTHFDLEKNLIFARLESKE